MRAAILPVYFTNTQFTSRLGETERQQATAFLQKHFPDGNYPESSRAFIKFVLTLVGSDAPNAQTPEPETVNALALAEAENRKLKAENEELRMKVLDLKLLPTAETGVEVDFSIFNDPRLKGFADFRLPEHTHPFETIERMKKLADESIIQYEALKFTLEQQPFQLLEPEEYAFLKKWDEEIFMPAMRTITGRPELVLTARHKYMMVIDYAQADPVQEVKSIFPNATPAQLQALEDLQFPRPSIVQQVLHDIDEPKIEPNDISTVVADPKAETETKVITLNPNGGTADPAKPAADSENENKPG
jgi:hypothetical protein